MADILIAKKNIKILTQRSIEQKSRKLGPNKKGKNVLAIRHKRPLKMKIVIQE